MHVEFDISGMTPPLSFVAAWMIAGLKEMEQHGLGVLVDGQPAVFEEPYDGLRSGAQRKADELAPHLPSDEPVVVEEAALDRLRKKVADLTEELTALRWLTMRDNRRRDTAIRKADYTCLIRVSTRLEDDKTWSAAADDLDEDGWTRGHRSRETAIGKALIDRLKRLTAHLESQRD